MSYKKLKVWQKAMALAKNVYEWTRSFPKEEIYGLVSQMRRAAVSVASNIAEGSQRTTDKDFANFILTSRGSLAELEIQTIIAIDECAGAKDHPLSKEIPLCIDELSRMLHAFHVTLTAHSSKLKASSL
ncbi:MAG: four helix bundle protein [Candidatus Peregrinibacteria bacterium]